MAHVDALQMCCPVFRGGHVCLPSMAADYDVKSLKIEVVWDMAVNSSHVDKTVRKGTKV